MIYNLPLILNEPPTVEWVNEHIRTIFPSTYYSNFHRRIILQNATSIYVRTRLCESQNWKCCWCGKRMTEYRRGKRAATTEHITPKSQGGTDDIENLAAACSGCNNDRQVYSVEEYMEYIKTGMKPYRETRMSKRKLRRDQSQSKREMGGTLNPEKSAAILALRQSDDNPFEEGSISYNVFERLRPRKAAGLPPFDIKKKRRKRRRKSKALQAPTPGFFIDLEQQSREQIAL